ncbi:hypothetical protein SADUNF_Sadunf08G0129100 [Salix dunnii]|uniref:Uncharacterized protein n=1 Tax=Salix dunnii TaxID=1413687 RepID=A0A835MU70_9ROSI|nr:hypothetical protein SADUNF_Sadunf08G0129100 [Salix dunnii]
MARAKAVNRRQSMMPARSSGHQYIRPPGATPKKEKRIGGLKSKSARQTSVRIKIHKVYLCHLVNLYYLKTKYLGAII